MFLPSQLSRLSYARRYTWSVGRQQGTGRVVLLVLLAFVAGIGLTWFVFRTQLLGVAAKSTAGDVAGADSGTQASSAWKGPRPRDKPSAETSPIARDRVQLSEVSRTGRIRTEAVTESGVPQTGALPGKIVVDENLTARLAAPLTGRVSKILREPGQSVKAGDVLAHIDAPDLASAQAEARKAQVEAALKLSAAQRMQELYVAGAVAQKELQAAQAESAEAQAELDRTRTRLRQLNGLGRHDGLLQLISPIAGVVTERTITTGQQVRADESTNLFVISDLRRLNVLVDVPEAEVGRLGLGQTLRIAIDGVSHGPLDAKIIRLGPGVDPVTRRVQVRARIDNDNGDLRPEMFVRAFGTTGSSGTSSINGNPQRAIEVPVTALTARGSETAVFIEREVGSYERIAVEVLAQHPERAWIRPLGKKVIGQGAAVVSQGALLLDSEIASR